MQLISETKTTGSHQNIAGSGTNTGFFLYGYPEFASIKPGWTCVETGAVVTVVGDGISNYDITTVGTPFASGTHYSFTGPTGFEMLGGMTLRSPKPSLIIATSDTGGLIGWSPQSLAIVYNADIMSTYPVGSTITFQDGSAVTITMYDPYAPNYIDIFWDTPKSGKLFPITLQQ